MASVSRFRNSAFSGQAGWDRGTGHDGAGTALEAPPGPKHPGIEGHRTHGMRARRRAEPPRLIVGGAPGARLVPSGKMNDLKPVGDALFRLASSSGEARLDPCRGRPGSSRNLRENQPWKGSRQRPFISSAGSRKSGMRANVSHADDAGRRRDRPPWGASQPRALRASCRRSLSAGKLKRPWTASAVMPRPGGERRGCRARRTKSSST